MPDTDLPAPARTAPVRDDHAWPFPLSTGGRSHVRLRLWPTRDHPGPLAIATDLMLGAGLINNAESLCRAALTEFGPHTVVVRHFPAWSMGAIDGEDVFDQLTLDNRDHARVRRCTQQVLDLLGPGVLGYPGDTPPAHTRTGAAVVPPQSTHIARALAALLRLDETRVIQRRPNGYPTRSGPVAEKDLAPLSHLKLGTEALRRLSAFLAEADPDPHESAAGAKREHRLGTVIHTLQEQTWLLGLLADELAAEERSRPTHPDA
ncbi:hypothetical protein ACFVV7_26630 [Streptomyces globisporus]|uniref:hypothetical protein n=1 Tax=Streptomyces globisporus TaxID=1908 RepID=UPI0036D9D5F8